jgi:hypothetical protein
MDTLFESNIMRNLDNSYTETYCTPEHIVIVTYNAIGNLVKKEFYNRHYIYQTTEMCSYENVFSEPENDIPEETDTGIDEPSTSNITTTSEKIQSATEQIIITYGDCVSIYPVSTSAEVYSKFLDKNPFRYRKRYENSHYIKLESRPKPGSVYVSHGPQKICCIFGQYYKGKSHLHNKYDPYYTQVSVNDSYEDRLKYFNSGLKKIGKLEPKSIAIPYKIGCQTYGGQWTDYEKIIENFAQKHPNIQIKIYNYKNKKYSKDT